MKRYLIAAALLFAAPAPAQQGINRALPEWLAGSWQMEDGAAWSEEVWMYPRGGAMLGLGRSGFGPQLQQWEAMRIGVKADGRVSLYAQPRGGPATEFAMVSAGPESIEFANPAHDYPQRIRYWRQGQLLMAETSRIDGSDVQRWNYRPAVAGE